MFTLFDTSSQMRAHNLFVPGNWSDPVVIFSGKHFLSLLCYNCFITGFVSSAVFRLSVYRVHASRSIMSDNNCTAGA